MIYSRQPPRASREPARNTHFNINAFCLTIRRTSSLFLLELSQFGMSYPRFLYTLTMLMPFTKVFVVNYLFNSRYFCNVIRF